MMPTTLTTCVACGRPDALGLGLCAECGSHGGTGDALVFVRRAGGDDRHQIETRLGELLGRRTETPAGRAAMRGDRALVRVPAPVTDHVVAALERNGVSARSVKVGNAFLSMPSHFFILLFAIALVGSMAGAATLPSLQWLSPLLAAGLLLIAHRSMQRPLLQPPAAAALPPAAAAAVVGAFARLSAGRARELLADLVGLAHPLLSRLREEGDPGALEPTVAELISTACATAIEVDRLETSAATVRDEIRTDAEAHESAALSEAAARCSDAAATGTQRLVEAVAAVANAGGRTALANGGAARRLSQLTRQLKDDAGRREDALREIDRLLRR